MTIVTGDISLRQVEMIEETFAFMTEEGWQIPQWVQNMRARVEARDAAAS